jgi:hypothetical protein
VGITCGLRFALWGPSVPSVRKRSAKTSDVRLLRLPCFTSISTFGLDPLLAILRTKHQCFEWKLEGHGPPAHRCGSLNHAVDVVDGRRAGAANCLAAGGAVPLLAKPLGQAVAAERVRTWQGMRSAQEVLADHALHLLAQHLDQLRLTRRPPCKPQ